MFSPADWLRAALLSMGPEGTARDLSCGPELSHREDSNGSTQEQSRLRSARSLVLGQDCIDGQILGQLRPLSEEQEPSGATFLGEPAFPEMDSEDLRLASFHNWPSTAGIQPESLAAAGFFHTGKSGGLSAVIWMLFITLPVPRVLSIPALGKELMKGNPVITAWPGRGVHPSQSHYEILGLCWPCPEGPSAGGGFTWIQWFCRSPTLLRDPHCHVGALQTWLQR